MQTREFDKVISIIVTTYNSDRYVVETLESIKNQAYERIELIISDDSSTDDTINTCRKWIESNSSRFTKTVVVTSEVNTGIPANCNRGVKASSGEWIKLIAGDDMLYPDAIDTYIRHIVSDEKSEKLFFHGKVMEFMRLDGREELSDLWKNASLERFNHDDIKPAEQFQILLRHSPVSAPTVIMQRSVYEEIGYFDEEFKFWEDRPMWLKLTGHGIRLHFIDEYLVKYRRHESSVQMSGDDTFFSRTAISKDAGYRKLILKHLPWGERNLHAYLITVNRFFLSISNNKKTFILKTLYKVLTIIPASLTERITKRYKTSSK